jgi:hypothetical protein
MPKPHMSRRSPAQGDRRRRPDRSAPARAPPSGMPPAGGAGPLVKPSETSLATGAPGLSPSLSGRPLLFSITPPPPAAKTSTFAGGPARSPVFPRPVSFPGQYLSQASTFPRPVPFPGQYLSQASTFPRPVPFPGQCLSQASAFPRPVPFPGQCLSRARSFPGQGGAGVDPVTREPLAVIPCLPPHRAGRGQTCPS